MQVKPASAASAVAPHASEQNQAARALDQGANRGLIARTLDQIAFPMTGNEAILDLGWAHVQAQHIGDLAAPVLAARAWTTLGPPMPQTRDQILAQAATGHGVERGVDGLVRHGLALVIRPRALESAGDLLGRPALAQIV